LLVPLLVKIVLQPIGNFPGFFDRKRLQGPFDFDHRTHFFSIVFGATGRKSDFAHCKADASALSLTPGEPPLWIGLAVPRRCDVAWVSPDLCHKFSLMVINILNSH
jgi:hypothetical protein